MFTKIELLRFVLMELKIVSQKLDSLFLSMIIILTTIEEIFKEPDSLQPLESEL